MIKYNVLGYNFRIEQFKNFVKNPWSFKKSYFSVSSQSIQDVVVDVVIWHRNCFVWCFVFVVCFIIFIVYDIFIYSIILTEVLGLAPIPPPHTPLVEEDKADTPPLAADKSPKSEALPVEPIVI